VKGNLAMASLRHDTATPQEQQKRRKEWRARIAKATPRGKKKIAGTSPRERVSRERVLAGVQSFAIVSTNPEDAKLYAAAGLVATLETPQSVAAFVIRQARERVAYIRKLLMAFWTNLGEWDDAAIERFLLDSWLNRFVSTSAGKIAKKELPWLSNSALRDYMKEKSDARYRAAHGGQDPPDPNRSRCHNEQLIHAVRDPSGRIIAERLGDRWSPTDMDQMFRTGQAPVHEIEVGGRRHVYYTRPPS
jgi:hypothetical protein